MSVGQADRIEAALERVEAKLDALLDALDAETDEPETVVVQTMDGQRFEVPAEQEHL